MVLLRVGHRDAVRVAVDDGPDLVDDLLKVETEVARVEGGGEHRQLRRVGERHVGDDEGADRVSDHLAEETRQEGAKAIVHEGDEGHARERAKPTRERVEEDLLARDRRDVPALRVDPAQDGG